MIRKQYNIQKPFGQNSEYPAETIPDTDLAVAQNVLLNEHEIDGDNVGTLTVMTGTTGFSATANDLHHFKSSGGSEFVLAWTGTNIGYHVVSSTTGTMLSLTLTSPMPPTLVNWGNEYIIALCGSDGNYKITASGTTLTAAAITTVPAANFGFIDNGMLHLAQDTTCIHSAPGDPMRWYPKIEELQAIPPTYTLDYRVNLADSGVMGETMAYFTWRGIKFLFTQYDLFALSWDGGPQALPLRCPGYGLKGYKSFALLDDHIKFYSNYKQGSICYLVLGAAGGSGQTFSAGQDLTFTIVEHKGAAKVGDVLRTCPPPTLAQKIIAVDSQADWENTALIATKPGFNTTTNPGWISLEGATKQTITANVQVPYNLISVMGFPLDSYFGTWMLQALTSGDIDSAPSPYPATTPTPTYYQCTFVGRPLGEQYINTAVLQSAKLYIATGSALEPLVDLATGTNDIVQAAGWTRYQPNRRMVGFAVELHFSFNIILTRYAPFFTQLPWTFTIIRRYVLSGIKQITDFYLYGVSTSVYGDLTTTMGIGFYVKIGEAEMWATSTSEGVITSAVQTITGLTGTTQAERNAKLGYFLLAYEGTGSDKTGGLTNVAAPTAVEIGLGATATPDAAPPNGWGTPGNPTAAGSLASLTPAQLKGYKLSSLVNGVTGPFYGVPEIGTIYLRFRIPATLDAVLSSPLIDKVLATFYNGSAAKSIYPMFTWRDKTILSLLENSSSTKCDKAVVINESGGCTVFDDINWTAGVTIPNATYVADGKQTTHGIAKLFEGTDNYQGATTNVAMEKIIATKKKFSLFNVLLRRIMAGITKYTPDETSWFTNQDFTIPGAGYKNIATGE